MKLKLDRKLLRKVIIGIIFLVITFVIFTIKNNKQSNDWFTIHNENEEIATDSEMVSSDGKTNENIIIDIAGEIKEPSVYILPEGSRVYQGIEAAGGLTLEADTRNINLAAELSDGIKLYIPSKKEVETTEKQTGAPVHQNPSATVQNVSSQASNALVNLNTADSTELQRLPGVGPAMSERILIYRDQYGGFKKIEELKNVSGIGEKTFKKLMNMITVE